MMLVLLFLLSILSFLTTTTADQPDSQTCYDQLSRLNGTSSQESERIASDYNLDLSKLLTVNIKDYCFNVWKASDIPAFITPKVWIASLISMTVISAVGLLGVAVVPLVQKAFFNSVIQYLVAVAVGTLTGDAFLHLIPHSLGGGHEHEEGGLEDELNEPWLNNERIQIFKNLVTLGGIYFFFLAEKAVSTITEDRAERKAEEEEKTRLAKNPRKSISDGATTSRKGLQSRRASGLRKPSISLQIPSDQGPLRRGSRLLNPLGSECGRTTRALSIVDDSFVTIGLSSRALKNIENLHRFAEQSDESGSENAFESESKSGELSLAVPQVDFKNKEKEITEPKKANHGHSHEIPGSILSVAWMVILGDGLHNFTDGLAIGAAFAKSTTGGISTSVAVFCHELPHELGDFAVLLKTGMGIRQALYFNIVSSVLAFLGMVIGIFLGTINGINTWIFLFTAGTFIYIALVDMLPQLTGYEIRVDESRLLLFFIQNVGFMTGVGAMLLIALYEEEMKQMLG